MASLSSIPQACQTTGALSNRLQRLNVYAKAGYDPTAFSGHSLQAGLATAAAQAGVSERIIMAQTGHKSVTVARRYIRRGELFSENAAADVGS